VKKVLDSYAVGKFNLCAFVLCTVPYCYLPTFVFDMIAKLYIGCCLQVFACLFFTNTSFGNVRSVMVFYGGFGDQLSHSR
jgi:hypothetical protein